MRKVWHDGPRRAAVQLDFFGNYVLTCPAPHTIHLYVVNSFSPQGPRAWNLSVLIPISAPRPNSPPSLNRVLAFTITAALSTRDVNRSAAARSCVTIESVCFEP